MEENEKRARAELKTLAQLLQSLPVEIKKAEDNVLTPQERELRSQRAQIPASIARVEEELTQVQRSLQLGKGYAERLAEQVKDGETELAALEQDLARLTRELEQKKAVKSPLEAAEADLRRVQSELAQIKKDLDDVEKYRTTVQARLQPMAERLRTLADFARASGNRAIQASR